MGCCGSTVPRNEKVDNARDLNELCNALTDIQKEYEDEISEIDSFLKDGKQMKSDNLSGFTPEQLKERSIYLNQLFDSLGELKDNIKECNDVTIF